MGNSEPGEDTITEPTVPDEQAIVNALQDKPIISVESGARLDWLTEAERQRVAAVVAPLIEAARNSRPNKGEVLHAITEAEKRPREEGDGFGYSRGPVFETVEKLFTDREPKPFRTPGFDGVEGTEYGERDWRV